MALFGIGSGIMDGVPRPKVMAAMYIRGMHLTSSVSAITVTAAQYYYYPIWLTAGEVFAGAAFTNSGAGDNGKKVKIAAYNQAAAGGPGTLAKSFGESTLTGAAALRQIASSWTVPSTGWYYMAFVSDTDPAIYGSQAMITDVGPPPTGFRFPRFVTESNGANPVNFEFFGYYVAGTYANFPEATSLTLTNTLRAAGTTATIPDFGLYA